MSYVSGVNGVISEQVWDGKRVWSNEAGHQTKTTANEGAFKGGGESRNMIDRRVISKQQRAS